MNTARAPGLHVVGENGSERLILRHRGRFVVVAASEVCWIKAERNYVRVYTRDREYLTRAGIAEIQRALDPATFVRIHRGAIINLGCARSFKPMADGGYTVELDQAVELRMSRSYTEAVLSRLFEMGDSESRTGDPLTIRVVE